MESTAAPAAWLREADVTREFSISQALLRKWRCRRIGPAYSRVGDRGVVLYCRSDVEAFLRARTVETGTSKPVPETCG